MNLFRSEEHIERWLDGRAPGATISVGKLSELAHAWWSDRLPPEWQPHTREQNQAVRWRPGTASARRPGVARAGVSR
jgi:hypothetical protein